MQESYVRNSQRQKQTCGVCVYFEEVAQIYVYVYIHI